MYDWIARENHKEDRKSNNERYTIRVREHVHAVLVDQTSSCCTNVALEVYCKVESDEPDIAKPSQSQIREEDKEVPEKQISVVVLGLSSIPQNWHANIMKEVPWAKNTSDWSKVAVNQSQRSERCLPVCLA